MKNHLLGLILDNLLCDLATNNIMLQSFLLVSFNYFYEMFFAKNAFGLIFLTVSRVKNRTSLPAKPKTFSKKLETQTLAFCVTCSELFQWFGIRLWNKRPAVRCPPSLLRVHVCIYLCSKKLSCVLYALYVRPVI